MALTKERREFERREEVAEARRTLPGLAAKAANDRRRATATAAD